MKMEQEQNLQNSEFIPPPPVSNMSDLAANDTFKQDLLQSAMVLDQTDGIQNKQMSIHHQQPNPNQMLMFQQQPQLDHEQMMIHQQQNQEHLIMHQHQQSQEEMMMQQQSIEDQINLNPPMEVATAPVPQDIHDDLAISDSDDEEGKGHPPPLAIKTQENEDENGGLWF